MSHTLFCSELALVLPEYDLLTW